MIKYDIGSKLRELRLSRNMTLRSVAGEIGFSIALLSQIEKNNISPPIPTLSKLAKFFDVKMSSLFTEQDEQRKYEIIRKNDRKIVSHVVSRTGNRHTYSYEPFSTKMRNKKMTPFLINLADTRDATTYSHDGESFIFVLKGTMAMFLDNQEIVLAEGDCIYFDSSMDHRFEVRKSKDSVILEVTASPS